MKKISIGIILLSTFIYTVSCGDYSNLPTTTNNNTKNTDEQKVISFADAMAQSGAGNYIAPAYNLGIELAKVRVEYKTLKNYAIKNNYNTDNCIVIDMHIPCFKKRFFLYDIKKDSLLKTALVAHGWGSETFKGRLIFSNIPDSKMSSLGKYKIGESYNGMWGFSYKLRGLDSSNSKAFERAVVLHSYSSIPDTEIDENPIAFSYGCPMVSPNFLNTLKPFISKAKKPILLSIIY